MAERDPPAPHLALSPRILRRLCLVKTLTHQDEIMGENPILPLTFDEATPLTMSIYDHFYHEFAKSLRIPDLSRRHYQYLNLSKSRVHHSLYTKVLLVFDTSEREYEVVLRYKRIGAGPCTYVLTEGWSEIVRDNNIETGDQIYLYQLLDPRVHCDYYYLINIVKKTGRSTSRPDGDIQMVGCSSH